VFGWSGAIVDRFGFAPGEVEMSTAVRSLVVAVGIMAFAAPALGAGKPGKDKKPAVITWVRIEQAQFSVEEYLGAFTSCAYRLTEEGKDSEFIYEDKARITVQKKKDGGDMLVNLYVAKGELKNISRELVVAAIEDATQECYERMTDR